MISEAFQKSLGEFKHKVTPLKHQETNFLKTRDLRYYANFWEMGCAKTKVMIDTAVWLFMKGEIDGVLVITDNGVCDNWPDDQLPTHLMDGIPTRIVRWKSTMGKKEQYTCNQLLVAKDDVLDIVVMNVEAFAFDKANIFARAFLKNHYGMIIIDESESIGHAKAKRTANILALRDLCEYRRILSGTPIADSPMLIYTQAEFLAPKLLGFENFVSFRAEYANLMTMDLGPGRKFYTITGYKNLDKLTASMKPWSSRLLKTDCLDLPEKIYETVYVDHTEEQRAVYEQLKEEALVNFEQGLLTSLSAITTLTKLHQINCGHVKLDKVDDTVQTIDIPSNRIPVLLDLLKKITGKVIIWACFKRDFELIGLALNETFGKDSWVGYYGDTHQNDRPENIAKFKTNKACRFFLSNPLTGGRGITLTEATYAIYYSQGFRLAMRLQSEDRNHRAGQKEKCTYIDLVTRGTVDIKIKASLKNKRCLSETVLDSFRELLT